ncbi:MAG: hypothetical protein ABEJ36_04975 [Candidatus Nanosalina sp.]
MGYEYRCERCGKVIEEQDRSSFVNELKKHFRNNHPDISQPDYLKQQYI